MEQEQCDLPPRSQFAKKAPLGSTWRGQFAESGGKFRTPPLSVAQPEGRITGIVVFETLCGWSDAPPRYGTSEK